MYSDNTVHLIASIIQVRQMLEASRILAQKELPQEKKVQNVELKRTNLTQIFRCIGRGLEKRPKPH